MSEGFTVRQFNYRFPTEDSCLEELKVLRFGEYVLCPKCTKINKFHKLTGRKAYSCDYCRYQLYPLKGTIFEKSTTPLKDWYYAIYLMTQTRAGISAKQLERMLGVTYKTAWRMFHQIRKLMADDKDMLTGEVEVDETYIGGSGHNRKAYRNINRDNKAVVFGMVERGGRAKVRHVKSSGVRALVPQIQKNVEAGTQIYSDEYGSYVKLPAIGYPHQSVIHSQLQFRKGNAHTQNVENLWSNVKRGIYGVYRHVDKKYLQSYINEYAFRYSNRDNPQMFETLLSNVAHKSVPIS